MTVRSIVGKSRIGLLKLGAGNGAAASPGFSISPNAGHTAGNITITVTYSGGAVCPASMPISISSGGGSVSAWVQDVAGANGSGHFTFTEPAASGTPTVFLDSVTSTTATFSNAPVVPGVPTGVSASAGNAQATVSFTAPGDNGGSAITGYVVTGTPGGSQSGASSPIVVTGLTNGTPYTFTVHATNAIGNSAESSASSPVTPTGPVTTGTVQQIAPYLSTDTLVTPGYQVYSGTGALLNALVTTGIATITGIANGRLGAISFTVDSFGGFHGYSLWQTGQATNVYAPRELYLPPITNPGSTGQVTKVAVFPYGTAMTSPGYQIFQNVAGVYTAVGSRITAGVTAIPNIPSGVSADVTLTLAVDYSFKGIIVWDNGAGVYAAPDEVVIPPFTGSSGGSTIISGVAMKSGSVAILSNGQAIPLV